MGVMSGCVCVGTCMDALYSPVPEEHASAAAEECLGLSSEVGADSPWGHRPRGAFLPLVEEIQIPGSLRAVERPGDQVSFLWERCERARKNRNRGDQPRAEYAWWSRGRDTWTPISRLLRSAEHPVEFVAVDESGSASLGLLSKKDKTTEEAPAEAE